MSDILTDSLYIVRRVPDFADVAAQRRMGRPDITGKTIHISLGPAARHNGRMRSRPMAR